MDFACFLQIAMVGNGRESFRYSVENGEVRRLRTPLGTPLTRSDGTTEILRDLAIPSVQYQPQYNASLNRAALPTQGFT
jgi:hypothetical protein